MASLQDLLEAYRNYRGVNDWRLGRQEDQMLGHSEQARGLWDLLQGVGVGDVGGGLFGVSKDINKLIRVADNPLAVTKNPTFARAYKIAQDDPFGELRLVRNPETGDVFIAPASSTLHQMIADVAGIPYDSRSPSGVWEKNSWGDNLANIKGSHIYSGVYDRFFHDADDASSDGSNAVKGLMGMMK